jgi:hypothetical protein
VDSHFPIKLFYYEKSKFKHRISYFKSKYIELLLLEQPKFIITILLIYYIKKKNQRQYDNEFTKLVFIINFLNIKSTVIRRLLKL